jgi:hypothetical protein
VIRRTKGVAVTSLLVDVVSREPLAAADGRSGSLLERVVLADGRALVVKHVLDGGDWIMRATADHGRAAELWSAGVLARVPEVIDHTVVGAEQVPGGWVVIMRDVSAALVPDHARVGRDDSRRVLEAAAALHAAFARPTSPTRRWSCARWPTATGSSPRPRPAARLAAPTRCRG